MSDDVLSRPAPAGEIVHYGELPEQVFELWEGGSAGLVAFIHGGFWRDRYDRSHVRPLCNDLAARGYTVAALEYRRTSPGVPGWRATFDDVEAALAALPMGLPLVIAGHSAGGHLALWSAWRQNRGAGVLALAPVADLAAAYRDDLGGGAVSALLGGSPEEFPERYAAADPIRVPLRVPAALIHGDADDQVPVTQSRAYAQVTGARLVELPDVDHYDVIDPESAVWPTVVEELDGVFGRIPPWRVGYGDGYDDFTTPEEGVDLLDRYAETYCNYGLQGRALWFGPSGVSFDDFPLRVDAALHQDGVAVRWRPDGTVLVAREDRRPGDMEICIDSHAPHAIVPAFMVRATLPAAKKALRDYVLTGGKPPGTWERADFPEYDRHLTKTDFPGSVIVREGAQVRAPLAVPEGYDLAALGELGERMPGEELLSALPTGFTEEPPF